MIHTHYATVRRGGLAAALAGVLLGAALAVAAPAAPASADSHPQSHADNRNNDRNDNRTNQRSDNGTDRRGPHRHARNDSRNDRDRDGKRGQHREDRRADRHRDHRHRDHRLSDDRLRDDGRRDDGQGGRLRDRQGDRRGERQSSKHAPTVTESESGSAAALGIRARLDDAIDIAEGRAAYPGDRGEDKLAAVTLGEVGTASTVTAIATGEASSGGTRAEAGVAELALDLTALRMGRFASGEIRAACVADNGTEARGVALLTDALLDLPGFRDVEFERSPAPNTTVRLPGGLGTAVLNEQNMQPDGSLTVNALHLILNDRIRAHSGELIIGAVNCLAGTGQTAEEDEEAGQNDEQNTRKNSTKNTQKNTRQNNERNAGNGASAGDDRARMVAAAEDARTGHAVHGVRMEIVRPNGSMAADCTTDESGTCAVEQLRPGTYHVRVADAPWGYVMPDRNEGCSGPYEAEAGKEVRMDQPFGMERSQFA